ncbi:Hypothetical predicted protein [Mytilus galloprovincialis]|uniref:Integrase catalytic domain-containing protein n=1 Tax=Mytilus galloprovincialis TaxID=29158 RepID=A0A8B6G7T3_MYTGA|nr:Hypothetical predicted protein [Mytilus galloprovincialis]
MGLIILPNRSKTMHALREIDNVAEMTIAVSGQPQMEDITSTINQAVCSAVKSVEANMLVSIMTKMDTTLSAMNRPDRRPELRHKICNCTRCTACKANSSEEHLEHLSQLFTRLKDANLKLQPAKCNFDVKEVKFLGHIMSRRGIEVDPEKTNAVSQFPVPKTVKQVRSFLGMANYYRRFIKSHSDIVSPLTALLRKDAQFQWTPQCQQAFETMKNALLTAPVLSYPDPNRSFILTCDASDKAFGYVLGQKDDEGREYVVAYGGKALSGPEKSYHTPEKECLAILRGVEAYRPYLANSHFTVAPTIQSVSTAYPTTDSRLESDTDLETDRVSISESDELPDGWKTVTEFIYDDEITDSCPIISAIDIEELPQALDNPDSLFEKQQNCQDFANIIKYLQNNIQDEKIHRSIVVESKFYSISNGVLYHLYQGRCTRLPTELRHIKQIALPTCLREEALHSYHDSLLGGGHLGQGKVYSSLLEKYYWPKMHTDVLQYIKTWDRCQRAKRNYNPNNPPLSPMPHVGRFHRWHIDILGPLSKTKDGYEHILLVVDSFTRWTEGFPMKTQTAKEVANILCSEVFSRFENPNILFSDQAEPFMAKIIKAICEMFQVKQHHSSSYHANTNGTVERQNSTLAACLRTYCNKDQLNWPSLIPFVMMAYRKSPSCKTTGYSPFYMMFGEEMRLPFDVALEPKDNLSRDLKDYIAGFLANLKIAHTIAKERDQQQKTKDKARHDLKSNIPNFSVGDQVLLTNNKVPKGLSRKLHDKANGPYRIIELGPNYTYKIKHIENNTVHKSLINATNMRRYYDPNIHRQRYIDSQDQIENGLNQNEHELQPPQVDNEVENTQVRNQVENEDNEQIAIEANNDLLNSQVDNQNNQQQK